MNKQSQKAIITGGASGLGFAVAKNIIAAGGQVCLLDINDERGQQAVAELGARSAFINTDVSSEDSVNAAVETANQTMQGINILINCAGILGSGRVLGREAPMPLDTFRRTIEVNLIGSFNVAKSAAAVMAKNTADDDGQRGVIINTASIAAYEGQIGQAAYSASKGGIVGMTLPMAREFTRFGIRVMTIAPGVFRTPMIDNAPQEVQDALGAAVPFPSRLGQADEFADLAAHIIDNHYLNGSTIRLDGAIRLAPK
ncbi:MAG: SDR family NAD(P)-dependent oxidoreductase [Xanthomonadales bacterium]|nr:SDR family NAD(P)-dependent oxidoreductase [Xanthomonadales bacterium]